MKSRLKVFFDKSFTPANSITGSRILLSIALLFCPAFSVPFYVLYLLAGISDMIDGTVARKTNTASPFGAKLDTVADLVFVSVCLIKLLPAIHLPAWEYLWLAVIVFLKAVNVISGFVIQKRFVTVHSLMNKATGALLLILPLTFQLIAPSCTVPVVCAAATFAAIQEGHLIRTGGA